MSPHPAQTDRSRIVKAAQALIERDGMEALTLGGVASELGIKTLELNGQFQRGGDLCEAFEKSVLAYLRGCSLV